MDNNETLELNAIEQAIATDPVNYLNSQPDPRKWTLSTEDIARSSSVGPYELFSTAQKDPEKYSWVGNVFAGLGKGVESILEPFGGEILDKALIDQYTYKTPNMSKEDAMRIYEDVMHTSSFIRTSSDAETAQKIRNNFAYSLSNGIGSMVALAGVGFVTKSPALVGALAALSAGSQVKQELVDKYIQEEGTSKGLADKRLEMNAISTAYGIFAGLTEMSIGVERLAAGAINRYAKMNALSRLARIQGKTAKAQAIQAAKEFGTSLAEEAGEEFIQSIGEDIAVSGLTEAFTDEAFLKAATQAMYGGLIGGPAGMAFYYVGRNQAMAKVKEWSDKNQLGLNQQQISNITDEILDTGTHKMADEIATRAELKLQYGPAYETLKQRIRELFEATGTTPWKDQGKSMEEFVEMNAALLANGPAYAANEYNMPMSEFIEVAKLQQVPNQPIWMFAPISNINDVRTLLDEQKAIIKQQNAAKKLGLQDDGVLERAQRRKAILELQLKTMEEDEKLQNVKSTRRKQKADYITAQQLMPTQTTTIDTAVQAEEDQEYVMFAGKRIPVEYQVVELADIQPSHINGEPNPNYTNTELQNRASRGTTQDVADLRGKALPENFTPERLTRVPTSAEGAPVINAQGEVIAGNGRAEIVRYAYENPQTAEKYKKALRKAGFNIEGMAQPILVRRNTTMTPEEQVAAADLSNISETSAFDEASQARMESKYIKDSKTPLDFAEKLPMSERRGLMNNDGTWNNRRVKQRYESALLSWLLGNDTKLFESLVLNGRLPQKVIDILVANGSQIYALNDKYPELNIRADIYHALHKMQYADKNNFVEITQQIEMDPRDVMPENVLVWSWLFADSTSARQLLGNYINILEENQTNVDAGADMFGDKVPPLSKKDALMQALKKTDEAKGQLATQKGKDYEPLFEPETGEVRNAELVSAIASYQNQFAPRPETAQKILNKEQFDLANENARLDAKYPEYKGETIKVDGKERTVYNSEGNRIAKSKEALTNFWRWFGDSKVVDEQGRPLVLYHGSPFSSIKEFMNPEDPERPHGIFFTTNKAVAETFVFGGNGKVYPVYLKMDNPQSFDEHGENWDDFIEWKWFENTPEDKDGIIVKNIVEAPAHQSETSTDYIVFNNKQIKSVENSGAYSQKTADIYNKIAYTSGATYFERPSTKYVLKGGEGHIIHGWGIYAMEDRKINKARYRDRWAGNLVFVRNMPKIKAETPIATVEDEIGTKYPILNKDLSDKENIALGKAISMLTLFPIAAYAKMNQGSSNFHGVLRAITRSINQLQDSNTEHFKQFQTDLTLYDWLEQNSINTFKNLDKWLPHFTPFLRGMVNGAAKRNKTTVNELTADEIKDYMRYATNGEHITDVRNIVAGGVLNEIVPDQSLPFYVELSNAIVKAAKGEDPTRTEIKEPFDNTIFADTEAIPIEDLGMLADNALHRAKSIIEDQWVVDEVVYDNPETYGGFIGLVSWLNYEGSITKAWFDDIIAGKITLDNLETTEHYKQIVDAAKDGSAFDQFLKSLIASAKKKYNSEKIKKAFPDADTRTWYAFSEAFRNLTKAQKEKMFLHLADNWRINKGNEETFLEILQNPQNIKKSRGQQLAIDVPEATELLNEEIRLSDQPSAPKLRRILSSFLPGGLLFDFVDKADETNWEVFAEAHNIQEKDLDEFHGRIFNDIMVDKIRIRKEEDIEKNEDTKLLLDYIMENIKGDDFYIAMTETIPETTMELSNGELIGEEKDYDEGPQRNMMGAEDVPVELARDTSLYLNDQGIKGIQYYGGTDKIGYVIFSDEAIKVLKRLDDELPIYYKKKGVLQGQYDPELQTLLLTKNWDELALVHEMHHRYLQKLWEKYMRVKAGNGTSTPAFQADMEKLFSSLGVTPDQTEITPVQQERFTYMVEAYLTGFGIDDPKNLAFQGFLHWIPEKVKSIYDLGYLDENGVKQNPMLDQETIDFLNRWFASPLVPSLPTAPDAQRMQNVTDEDGEIIPSEQKVMNNREKEWGQDSEQQNKADAQLWQAIGENNPSDLRAALDGEKELMKAEANNNPDDTILPERPKLRDKWFKTHQPDARELAAEAARAYLAKNPDHARELAFADPETLADFDAPVDQGMLIRAVMETVGKGSDEWYILDNNLAMVKSMSGSTLSLSGDLSHQAYLDAKREVEEARELKAAVNYAGTRQGAMEKWNEDIRAFAAKRVAAIVKTAPNSKEREVAIKAFLEEAKTKFSGNTTNAILNKLDMTAYNTTNEGAFIKWAEKQIREVAHARLDTKEQAELMKASIAAQVALQGINSTEVKEGKYVRAIQSAKDIRHWQYVKDKMKKAYIGRWGRFGIFVDNLFGGYMPSAMLMSINTLFFANVPSTAINNFIVSKSALWIGENKVDEKVLKGERERIKQVFNASGLNLAQMEKPSSPSLMHGEKYTNQEQKHWYNFTFDVLSREDNWFRIPTFVDVLGRIATKNAKDDAKKATELFRRYSELGNKDEDAVVARKQALAVANMAVFTQDGIMASALNHIRSQLNNLSRGMLGLEPGGFGLGNMLAPFLKTGANVIEMGLTASLAPIRTATTALRWAQGKEITDARKIALTTDWAYMALAVVATAIMAAITSDDDDWYTEPYETGKRYDPDKPYDSIKVGSVWVKLDIFGPLEVPLRTAAMLVKNWEKEKLGALADGMQESFEEIPLVNQFLDNQMGYMKRKPGDYWRTWGYNQANKLVPAQLKSIARTASRAEGAEWTPGMFEGTNLERKFHRNYGFDGLRLTTNDLLNLLTNRLKTNPK